MQLAIVALAVANSAGATELIVQVNGIMGTVFWSLDGGSRQDGRNVSAECSNHTVWLEMDPDAARAAWSMRRPLTGWEGTATRTAPTVGCLSTLESCIVRFGGYPNEAVPEASECRTSFKFPDAIVAAYMSRQSKGLSATLLLFDNGEDCLASPPASREVFLRCEYDGPDDALLRLPLRGESMEAWRDRVADMPVGKWVQHRRSFAVLMAAMGAPDAILPRNWPGPGQERQALVARDFSACTSISNGNWAVYQGCPLEADDAGMIGAIELPVPDPHEAGAIHWHGGAADGESDGGGVR